MPTWSHPSEGERTTGGARCETGGRGNDDRAATGPLPGLPPGWAPPPAAPAPGVIPLRPLTIVEILDGALTTLRTNPRPTIGPALVVSAVVGALSWVAGFAALDATSALADLGSSTFEVATTDVEDVVGVLAPVLVAGTVTTAMQLVGVLLLTGVVTVVVSEAVLLPLMFLCLIAAVWIGVGLCLAVSVRVMEPAGVGGMPGALVAAGPWLVVAHLRVSAAHRHLTLPFGAAVVSLIYIDRRMRQENLHLALAEAAR